MLKVCLLFNIRPYFLQYEEFDEFLKFSLMMNDSVICKPRMITECKNDFYQPIKLIYPLAGCILKKNVRLSCMFQQISD